MHNWAGEIDSDLFPFLLWINYFGKGKDGLVKDKGSTPEVLLEEA